MTLSIMTLSVMTLSVMTLSVMTLSKITLNIMAFSIMTISIMTLYDKVNCDTQHGASNIFITMLSAIPLSVVLLRVLAPIILATKCCIF
jgi:hypothetical protein